MGSLHVVQRSKPAPGQFAKPMVPSAAAAQATGRNPTTMKKLAAQLGQARGLHVEVSPCVSTAVTAGQRPSPCALTAASRLSRTRPCCIQICQDPRELKQLAGMGLISPHATRMQLISLPCLSALAQHPKDQRNIALARQPSSHMSRELAKGLGHGLYQQAPLPLAARLSATKAPEGRVNPGACVLLL